MRLGVGFFVLYLTSSSYTFFYISFKAGVKIQSALYKKMIDVDQRLQPALLEVL